MTDAPTIVIAEDDEDIRTLVEFRLRSAGYQPVATSDGAEALALIREHLPALAILDVMMPHMTGVEITRALRADESTRAIPVILLTARVQEADETAGFEAGADDYIRKPFSPNALISRVQAILGRR
jgi:DNA-binding response OmpR family regulator